MMNDKPDWIRLQKALAIESEQGFTDLMGKQYRFSEFFTLTFGKFPTGLPTNERRRWQELSVEFANYSNLGLQDRQRLISETRKYLYQLQQTVDKETIVSSSSPSSPSSPSSSSPSSSFTYSRILSSQAPTPSVQSPTPNPHVAGTPSSQIPNPQSKIIAEVSRRLAPKIDQKLRELPEIGIKKAGSLERLGLETVRDLLFYYPRDHIDYSRQAHIRELEAGRP